MAAVSHATYLGFLGGHLKVHGVVLIVVFVADSTECFSTRLSIEVDNCDCLHNLGLAECLTLDYVLLEELLSTFLDRIFC